MNRSLIILIVVLLFGTQFVFARGADEIPPAPVTHELHAESSSAEPVYRIPAIIEEYTFLPSTLSVYAEFIPYLTLAAGADTDAEIPRSIRNNRYFVESVRLTNLAQLALEEGDYDASSEYSEEAVRYAYLSDEYVRLQLKIRETDDAIAAARRRLDFADSVNASVRYPNEYSRAQTAFGEARSLRASESWDPAIEAANRVLAALAGIEGEQPREEPVRVVEGPTLLPSQYTVRPWNDFKDCLWNIAGRSWVYADPQKWKILYDANKSKMPESDNPDLIHPGMVLDIPSIKGEARQGMWDATKTYPSLP